GGAQTLAVTMVKKFGDEKAAWALVITGLVISIPVFFDAGLIILIPLAFSLAKRTKKSSLFYAIPLLAGLAVGHAFIPPTPGPVLVATML
ncbi:gluconate permease, partial [Xanthomonas citri pv. citri]|nr:gluconate permease [Xanthomonas citri pv. citri]